MLGRPLEAWMEKNVTLSRLMRETTDAQSLYVISYYYNYHYYDYNNYLPITTWEESFKPARSQQDKKVP